MALFRSDDSAAPRNAAPRSGNPAEQHTSVGAGTVLGGSLRAQGNLDVSRTVTGGVSVEGRTMVMPGVGVGSEVSSTEAEVAGHIKGTLTVRERLVLRPAAVIDGRCEMDASAVPSVAARPSRTTTPAAAPAA